MQKVMSALPPKADMCGALGDVRLVPIADINLFGGASWVLTPANRDHQNGLRRALRSEYFRSLASVKREMFMAKNPSSRAWLTRKLRRRNEPQFWLLSAGTLD